MMSKTTEVTLNVSKSMLARMKKEAGLQGEVSNNRIVYSYIKTMLILNHE